jgi:hypothetical protein
MKILTLFGIATFIASFSLSASDQIHVTDLQAKPVVGRLGKSLGSHVVIAGTQATKAAMLPNAFDVVQIDSHAATNVVTIEIRGNVTVQPGTHYKLEGYESGGFESSPMWLNPEVQQPFQFRSFFVVTKVIEPKPK